MSTFNVRYFGSLWRTLSREVYSRNCSDLSLFQYIRPGEFMHLGVRSFLQFGVMFSLITDRVKNAKIPMRQVWGIQVRKFKDDFKRRLLMFDRLINR